MGKLQFRNEKFAPNLLVLSGSCIIWVNSHIDNTNTVFGISSEDLKDGKWAVVVATGGKIDLQ